MTKFHNKKTLQDCRNLYSGRKMTVRNDENCFEVLRNMNENSSVSLRSVATDLGISYGSVSNIVHKDLHLFPYHLVSAQGLSRDDCFLRVESCFRFKEQIPRDMKSVIFSDEATFKTDDQVNSWNCRIWSTTRPDNFIHGQHQNADKVTVWAAMTEDKLFGPYFFPESVTAESYCDILKLFFFEEYQISVWESEPFLMQDGAPAHTSLLARSILKEKFGNRVIGKFFDVFWPPRSPDLNPLDYFLWGFVREKVYRNGGFNDVSTMSTAIIEAFAEIRRNDMNFIANACLSFWDRVDDCINREGKQLIHR